MRLAAIPERGIGEELFHIGQETALIFLAGENVIGLLFDNLGGDGLLRSHGVDGDDRALDRQHVEKFGDCGDFIALGLHFLLRRLAAPFIAASCTMRAEQR